jgi:hypothetical protein
MKVTQGDYFTVQEMSNILGEATNTIKQRITRLGIKPIARGSLYEKADFERIKDAPMGRPKKENPHEKKPEAKKTAAKPTKKSKK